MQKYVPFEYIINLLICLQLYSKDIGNEGTPAGRGAKVFKSKLTFQIQHEVFRYSSQYRTI